MAIKLLNIPSRRGSGITTAFSLVSSKRSGLQTLVDIIPREALAEQGISPAEVLKTFREKERTTGTGTRTALRKLRRAARFKLGISRDA